LERAEEYVNHCWDAERQEMAHPISITGLCTFLGTTRKQLSDYETGSLEGLKDGSGDDEAFRSAIKHVKHVCEQYAEEHGFQARNPAFAIFALKNYGWKDTQTIETTSVSIHTVDPEIKWLVGEYIKQLAERNLRPAIDVTPAPKEPILARGQIAASGGDGQDDNNTRDG
jgi:ribonuclease BN (tRNA processing enzyme)